MASYIQININTANAPHFATWYHNRSGQAMSFLTAAVLNYAIKVLSKQNLTDNAKG